MKFKKLILLLSLALMAGAAFGAVQSAIDATGGRAVVQSLSKGGYILVMRHASSPRQTPDKSAANPDNVDLDRQLDETGRSTAKAMGEAFRRLKIPVGEIWTSPAYRALETIRVAGGFEVAKGYIVALESLGDGGQSMQAAGDTQAEWLKKRVTQAVPKTNVLVVTHMPNISRAFPNETNVADGEVLIFQPGSGSAPVVRVKIEEWPKIPN